MKRQSLKFLDLEFMQGDSTTSQVLNNLQLLKKQKIYRFSYVNTSLLDSQFPNLKEVLVSKSVIHLQS